MNSSPKDSANFNEEWYSDAQCKLLAEVATSVAQLEGDVVEIGCWEGRSTIALANACFPAKLFAVDTWGGNVDESPTHPSVLIAKERDVFKIFKANIAAMTKGNVSPQRMLSTNFLGQYKGKIKLCHIDASHDYDSVRSEILAALPLLVNGGVLCGDDFLTSHRHRKDLKGGVERAVRELLPGYQAKENFWWWKQDEMNAWNKLVFTVKQRLSKFGKS